MKVFPDFGYEKNTIEYRDFGGWKIFCDYISKEPKYQKLKNYIDLKRKVNIEKRVWLIQKSKNKNQVEIIEIDSREKK